MDIAGVPQVQSLVYPVHVAQPPSPPQLAHDMVPVFNPPAYRFMNPILQV